MTMDTLVRLGGALLMLAAPLVIIVGGEWLRRSAAPPPAQLPAPARNTDADWLALPFQLIAGVAGLLWCVVGLLVFLSPLLLLAWAVFR